MDKKRKYVCIGKQSNVIRSVLDLISNGASREVRLDVAVVIMIPVLLVFTHPRSCEGVNDVVNACFGERMGTTEEFAS